MEYNSLLNLVGDDPVFESAMLLSGEIDPKNIRLQLSRWVNSGRVYQLRRGLYAIAPPYQKTIPHPFLVANHLQRSSYVSLQSVLAFYGMIPDTVTVITSVGTGRPEKLATPLGTFEYRHVKSTLFFGYQVIDVGGQEIFVATPGKALLDLVYLTPDGDSPGFLQGLRLQNLDRINLGQLQKDSMTFDTPKMDRAAKVISQMAFSETTEYEDL
ncbi:MAG: hypothetical protein WBI14_01815 [Anaerolineaceae bacterium]